MSKFVWVLVCLLHLTIPISAFTFKQRVYRLSTPKREIGGAAINGVAYFGGGCTDTKSPWVCDNPTDVIDIVHPSKRISYRADTHLSAARGWPSTCATGSKVVFAGGGVSGTEPHSKVADVLDVVSGKMTTYPVALGANGRWGLGCATRNGTINYGGGKICHESGCRHPTFDQTINTVSFNSAGTANWGVSVYKLSHGRESIGTIVDSSDRLIFAGGWDGLKSSGWVDVISTNGKVSTSQLNLGFYWVGVASVNGNVYIVGNDYLYVLG